MWLRNKIPLKLRLWFRTVFRLPIARQIRMLTLRGVKPLSENFGYDRGGERIGRFYIQEFLRDHRSDIKGRVLEVADNEYTKQFGSESVLRSDVLHVTGENSTATIIADLTDCPQIEDASFDCIILTQTLQFIFDIDAVVRTLRRIVKPGGVVLATASGISQVSRYDMDRWGDYWRFTDRSMSTLFERHFGENSTTVRTWGNVLTAFGVLQGLTTEEFTARELMYHDNNYPVLVTIRAKRSEEHVT